MVLISDLRALLTPSGQAVLRSAESLEPEEKDFLAHFQVLCREHQAGLARAALEIAILRREAAAKFPFAGQLYLTRPALEQASSWEIACYRAERFVGQARVCDLGCSVGSDSLALAQVAAVIGVDLDPLRLLMADQNTAARGKKDQIAFLQADINAGLPFSVSEISRMGVFGDPARRAAGRRIYSLKAYQPSLAVMLAAAAGTPALGIKLSPGLDLAELDALVALRPFELEFISYAGELKEAVLWAGDLVTAVRRATLLPGRYTLQGTPDSHLDDGEPRRAPLRPPGAYLYEPDPAVLRAGLVGLLAQQLQAAQLDEDIAYLTADHFHPTPFARAWRVEAWFPFAVKRLRAYLRTHKVGRVTVKKRGSPLQPEELIRTLRLEGPEERVVFLTHLLGRPIVLVGIPHE